MLEWNRVYRTTSYVRSALWPMPIIAVLAVMGIAPVLRAIDEAVQWRGTGLDVDGATALFQSVITLTLSFVVFTFGSLLVAIQVASGQLTPRIIATALLRDNVVRYSVGLFVFTLMLTIAALNRLHGHVNDIVALLVGILGVACVTVFLFFIDYAARLLRPGSLCARIAVQGLEVIDVVFPRAFAGQDDAPAPRDALGPIERVVDNGGDSAVVLAIDQVHRLLRVVGRRELRGDATRDAEGAVRVLVRRPDWEDFVHMACVEIRACGASSVQVARRMEAMLGDLIALLPPVRRPALQAQRALLERAIDAQHAFEEDAALARVPDLQGLGGSPRIATPAAARTRREAINA